MEQIYAFGVTCIEFIQDWFQDYDEYFEMVNHASNPHKLTEYLFPALSVVDSVFAAQLLLCLAFGGWLNSIMKWLIYEDRPYWWVRESTFYETQTRPRLLQTRQTCETGPGSPSGHTSAAALALTLAVMFTAHVAHDRKWRIPWYVKSAAYPLLGWLLGSVMFARMYVAAHFPHQCILGALIGVFLAPLLCLHVSDPFIWRYGRPGPTSSRVVRHCAGAALAALLALLTYGGVMLTKDPMSTVHLAFRWCENPDSIQVNSSPIYALVENTGYLFGWALAVTPAVAKYRHDTRNRSLIISLFCTILCIYAYREIDENICKNNTFRYYLYKFIMFTVKPMIFLRIIPTISMWPFNEVTGKIKSN